MHKSSLYFNPVARAAVLRVAVRNTTLPPPPPPFALLPFCVSSCMRHDTTASFLVVRPLPHLVLGCDSPSARCHVRDTMSPAVSVPWCLSRDMTQHHTTRTLHLASSCTRHVIVVAPCALSWESGTCHDVTRLVPRLHPGWQDICQLCIVVHETCRGPIQLRLSIF